MTEPEDLATALRLRDEQLAVIAHDLRGPLSSILLLLQRVRDEVDKQDPAVTTAIKPNLTAVAKRLDHYVLHLGKLLDASRIEAAGVVLETTPLELVEVVRDIVEDLRGAQFRPPAVTFTGVEAVAGRWDPTALDQVIRNVVANALQFGDGKPFHVDVDSFGTSAIIKVRDEGKGIAAAEVERAFGKHVKLQKSKGFGLGLWIARRYAAAMGGTITVETKPGTGAEFVITLPRSPSTK